MSVKRKRLSLLPCMQAHERGPAVCHDKVCPVLLVAAEGILLFCLVKLSPYLSGRRADWEVISHLLARQLVQEHAAVQLLDDARVLADDLAHVRDHRACATHVLHAQPCPCPADCQPSGKP